MYKLINTAAVCSPQNLIAQSQSGTGKTAAFVLAMLSHVDPNNKYPQVGLLNPFLAETPVGLLRVNYDLSIEKKKNLWN